MANRKNNKVNEKNLREWELENEKKRARSVALRAGSPTRRFSPGEEVRYGGHFKTVVQQALEDGLLYQVKVFSKTGECSECKYVSWSRLFPVGYGTTSFTSNEDIRLSFMNSSVESLMSRHFLFGVDFAPDYQRGLVWSERERQELLDSVFMGADIGRFVFRVKDFSEVKSDVSGDFLESEFYEVVDGKQRLSTLLDFYLGRFSYHGVFFHELSARDRRRFEDASVSVAEVKNMSKRDTLRLFLMLNRGGVAIPEKHIEKVQDMLQSIN